MWQNEVVFLAEEVSMTRPCRLQGLAICWCQEAVYYISLKAAHPLVTSFVAKMLANKQVQKITFDLKAQIKALFAGKRRYLVQRTRFFLTLAEIRYQCSPPSSAIGCQVLSSANCTAVNGVFV